MSGWLIVLLVIGLLILLPSLYLFLLTLMALVYRPPTRRTLTPKTRFAILVPAHNEELLLPRLLEGLQNLEYPKELYDTYVVADNCSDSTAQIARRYRVTVMERQDPELRGKGYALRWLLERIPNQERPYEAYLFLDADCLVTPNILAVMDSNFQSGSKVVQSYYTASNATQTPTSALRYVALTLKHYVRPLGRKALGLSCGLFGTGMGFHRSVIERYKWDAFTLAEDVEYYMKLTRRGTKVDFAPEATVWGEMPASLKDSRTQNLRWERGRLQMAWKHGLPLFWQGLVRRNWVKLDAAIEQLIPPLSITFTLAWGWLLLSILAGPAWLIALAGTANLALVGHLFLGLLSAGVPLRVYTSFAYAPWFIAWKFLVYGRALLPGQLKWTRTVRPEQ